MEPAETRLANLLRHVGNVRDNCLAWVKDRATGRFKFTTRDRVYKDIKGFVEKLLERQFT